MKTRESLMEQYRIWDYYQNEGLHESQFSEIRQRYMVSYLRPGTAVLNIGIGDGAFERLALKKGVDIWSLDPNERAIQRLRRELGLGDRARSGYAQEIPFSDGQFDGVVMCEVLEHLEDEVLHDTLGEVLRVLRPGGHLLLSTPYCEDMARNHAVCPACGCRFHRKGHVRSLDIPGMTRLLVGNGFVMDRIRVSAFVDWHARDVRGVLKAVVRFVLGRLGERVADPHIIARARKPT
jgi:SAM-dependent methyltransferase